jgi:hypothetical protein
MDSRNREFVLMIVFTLCVIELMTMFSLDKHYIVNPCGEVPTMIGQTRSTTPRQVLRVKYKT